MAAALIETKFHAPPTHGRLIERPRLDELIGRGMRVALTLVSAPAGFGKSTLMAAAVERAASEATVAWLSLDSSDDDPKTFWTYVIAAVDRAAPGIGRAAAAQLDVRQGSIELALTNLVNDFSSIATDVILVLDDLHVVEDVGIHRQLMFLLDHVPPRVHVIIGTRADPPMPLARLRARGAMVEIRAADLRFTTDEAATYLTESMGLSLSATNVAALETRTEGWIAALQLAALSLQGREDVAAFIERFAGDDRYIVDYLVEEVLSRQPEDVREFLLETSILSRMTAPLVEAVTGRAGGAATLSALDRGNLFVVALDDQRRWYRYHHLFGDVLRARLLAERASDVARLHQRASDWLESAGDRADAIRHALAGEDFDRAADLIERAIPEMRQQRAEPPLRRWFDALPDEIYDVRPILAVGYAGTMLSTGSDELAGPMLQRAERWLGHDLASSRASGMVVANEDEFRRLPGMFELYRAGLAKLDGDLSANMAHARRLLDLVGPDDHVERGGAEALLGLGYWELGQLELAERWYDAGMTSLAQAGYVADVVGGAVVRADLKLAQGRLSEARAVYEEGLARATRHGQPILRGAADMHLGLGDNAYERGDLDAAEVHLAAAEQLGEELAFPRYPYRSRLARARILQALGDVDRALELLAEADVLYRTDFSPDIRPIPAVRARVLIGHDRLAEARAWARASGVEQEAEATYLLEFRLLTLARLLTVDGSAADAVGLTGRLLQAAEAADRAGSILEILVVDALARHASGDLDGALRSLDRAIALAAAEGYARLFLDEGLAMVALMKVGAKRREAPAYLHELIGANGPTPRRSSPKQGVIDALSERETEVLRLLQSELGGPEIASELVVSLNTLRSHTKSIYAKLGVTSRRAAVRRAAELDLL
jgi:LuxR family maltose regulon positive regulatory protein